MVLVSARLEMMAENFKKLFMHKKFRKYLIIFIGGSALDFSVYAFTVLSLPAPLDFSYVVLMYMAYSLSWLVKITPGNIGVQEGAMAIVALSSGYGILNTVALSFCLRLVYLIGAIFLYSISHLYIGFEKRRA